MTTTEHTKIAEKIEAESERQCIAHLGGHPSVWLTGGSDHNDDRLTATVSESGAIEVTDGNAYDTYEGDGSDDDIRAYVADWLSSVWS